MTSLRFRLFLLVAGATAIVWSIAAAWTVLSARADVERVLDRRLQEAAIMVASLGYDSRQSPSTRQNDAATVAMPSYDRQLSCQVWSVGGRLLGASQGAPEAAMSGGETGFSERTIDSTAWRVYTHVSPDTGLRVMVGDTVAMRTQLIADLMQGLVVPAAIGLFALALLIWIGIGRGLAPLRHIASVIGNRRADDQFPLAVGRVPDELAPLTREIDELFTRIANFRDGERRFLASAAHEMQTPLAGLKTHAEIALRTTDDDARRKSLERIRQSVDRTTRLVRQLLDLARERSPAASAITSSTLLGDAFEEVVEELEHLIEQRQTSVGISPRAKDYMAPLPRNSLIIALRNLIENALLHGPANSEILVDSDGRGFCVRDAGPGLSDNASQAMLEPFIRDAGSKTPGSGLGLSIVNSALAPGMRLHFERDGGGYRVCAQPVDLEAPTDTGQSKGHALL